MNQKEKALRWMEKRRQAFVARHNIKLSIKLHKAGKDRSEWVTHWTGDPDEGIAELESIQNGLAFKAKRVGLSNLTTEELIDFMDVEELWWHITSGDSSDFHRFAPTIAAIVRELQKRNYNFGE